ncbi:NAD-dependent epimerase/dehydratase family protein [Streptomyces coacervatus]|uniref:NAD-dependent epimerase/dehydratase family protein n=1 Tax=Streptomyces coacervatus TaxID=647381 RepID=A0ABP7IQW3_9ACTN|nr:NAD(P)-dependent oxidoreductase [Streptomyces coacervatus]MDF2266809.1 NAD(P)-dependent oxidoreductase [Streptomyces coacervatus]
MSPRHLASAAGARLLVTGASGFIGGHVVRALLGPASSSAPGPAEIRLLAHRRAVPLPDTGRAVVREVPGGLADHVALRELCDGVDTVVHLANRIEGSLEECAAVNVDGTRALLRAAAAAGVRRVLYLSTTSVYEDGCHRGEPEDGPSRQPQSPAGLTRLRAEEMVREAGGIVVRPHLVYGEGDRWVVPAAARLLQALPGWVDAGTSRMTLIAVDDLARAVAALALAPWDGDTPTVLHAGHPEPVRSRELLTAIADALTLPLPEADISLGRARLVLGAAQNPRQARLLSLLATDHWYECSRIWQLTGCDPGPGFSRGFPRHAPWYGQQRRALAAAAS